MSEKEKAIKLLNELKESLTTGTLTVTNYILAQSYINRILNLLKEE